MNRGLPGIDGGRVPGPGTTRTPTVRETSQQKELRIDQLDSEFQRLVQQKGVGVVNPPTVTNDESVGDE